MLPAGAEPVNTLATSIRVWTHARAAWYRPRRDAGPAARRREPPAAGIDARSGSGAGERSPSMKPNPWNRFWTRSRGGRFTRESWSKRRILERLCPVLRAGMRVLDAGCGSGFFSKRFLDEGCRVTALDLSEEALALAREATEGRADAYVREDLLDAEFAARRAASFDLVFSDGLLEHYGPQDQERILSHFRAILAPGGYAATFVPNALSGWTLVRPLLMPGIREVPLRPKRLLDLHRGLAIVETGGLNVLPFRLSPERLLGARFGMLLYVIARKEEGV